MRSAQSADRWANRVSRSRRLWLRRAKCCCGLVSVILDTFFLLGERRISRGSEGFGLEGVGGDDMVLVLLMVGE